MFGSVYTSLVCWVFVAMLLLFSSFRNFVETFGVVASPLGYKMSLVWVKMFEIGI